MKNILVLNYEFPPLGGGQANANYYLFKEFSKNNNFNYTLITSSSHKYFEEVFSDNIKIIYLDIGKKGKNSQNQSIKDLLCYTFKTLIKSYILMKNNKYDLLMCWSYPAIGIGYLYKKIFDLPYISLLRGAETPFYEKKWEKLDKYIFQYLAPVFWKNSYKVIANSNGLKDLALNILANQNIEIIENGINLEEFNIEKNKNKNIFNILYVGRLTQRKGIHYLLDGFKTFSNNKENVVLNIIGTGEEYDNLLILSKKYYIENKVIFQGKKEHKELAKEYNNNDIYVLASENEGMSNTLLEALASSLPIIITNVGGTSELFNDNGWLINVNDSSDITNKLEIAYLEWQNGNLDKKGKKSFEIVKNKSWTNIANEYEKILTNSI